MMDTTPKANPTLEDIAELYAEISQRHCEDGCGQPYPDDVDTVGNTIVIATLDPGKEYSRPMLRIVSKRQAMKTYRIACQRFYGADWHDQYADFLECFFEVDSEQE